MLENIDFVKLKGLDIKTIKGKNLADINEIDIDWTIVNIVDKVDTKIFRKGQKVYLIKIKLKISIKK